MESRFRRPKPSVDAGALSVLLDALEQHRSIDVADRLHHARQLELQAADAGDDTARMRAQLVAADMLQRSGELHEGFRRAYEVERWAEVNGSARLRARSHLVLSSVFSGAGDAAAALEQAVLANEALDDDAPARVRGNHVLCLADALALVGAVEEARRRYGEAQACFAEIGDRERELNALNNLVVLEWETGNGAAAAEAAERLADRAASAGEMNPAFAETIARARMAVGDHLGALEMIHAGLDLLVRLGDAQAATPAELLLTHAEASVRLERLDDAGDSLARCRQVCEERGLIGLEVEAIRVEAEVLAGLGDYRAAYETHRRFHDESVALRSRAQEAAARTRHELFETAEVRQQAERFWRQARSDALTGLSNRRFADEMMPRLLDAAGAGSGPPVVATIVDIDHFKAINDRCSHAVGDRVLQQLARLLESEPAADRDARNFVARLGGEEFILVHSTEQPAEVVDSIERLRVAVQLFDWSEITAGLTVTFSAGVAVAEADDTPETLLARADRRLYAAKAAGRNRVIADDPPF